MSTEFAPSPLWLAVTSRLRLPADASLNEVHKHIGPEVGRTTLSRMRRGEGSMHGATLEKVAAALGCAPGDLLPKTRYDVQIEREIQGIREDQLVYQRDTVPDLKWETLMSRIDDLPEEFWTLLPDDALGRKAPRGTRAKFSTSLRPQFGDVVMLKAPDAQLHVRVLQQSLVHGWQGVALHPHYQPIQGDEPGTRIVAVFSGIDAPWAQLFS